MAQSQQVFLIRKPLPCGTCRLLGFLVHGEVLVRSLRSSEHRIYCQDHWKTEFLNNGGVWEILATVPTPWEQENSASAAWRSGLYTFGTKELDRSGTTLWEDPSTKMNKLPRADMLTFLIMNSLNEHQEDWETECLALNSKNYSTIELPVHLL